MTKYLFTITIILISIYSVNAQDKIIYRNGDVLSVNITVSSPEFVQYNFPNETLVNQEYKNNLTRIIYRSGRIEECSSEFNLETINGIKDWEKVIITFNLEDVRGLTKVGEIVGKSGWGGVATSLAAKGSRKSLKKEAAKLNAPIILVQQITDGQLTGGRIYGIAYK